jgi:hypothetical protein
MLLNFFDRTLSALTAGPSSPSVHIYIVIVMFTECIRSPIFLIAQIKETASEKLMKFAIFSTETSVDQKVLIPTRNRINGHVFF